jgi:hypothetical protein
MSIGGPSAPIGSVEGSAEAVIVPGHGTTGDDAGTPTNVGLCDGGIVFAELADTGAVHWPCIQSCIVCAGKLYVTVPHWPSSVPPLMQY